MIMTLSYSVCSPFGPSQGVATARHEQAASSPSPIPGHRLMLPDLSLHAVSSRNLRASWPRRTSYGRSYDLYRTVCASSGSKHRGDQEGGGYDREGRLLAGK